MFPKKSYIFSTWAEVKLANGHGNVGGRVRCRGIEENVVSFPWYSILPSTKSSSPSGHWRSHVEGKLGQAPDSANSPISSANIYRKAADIRCENTGPADGKWRENIIWALFRLRLEISIWHCSIFVCIWQLLSNHGLTKLKRFVS